MNRVSPLFALIISLVFSTFFVAQAQSNSCSVSLPVGLVDRNGNLLEGLTARDITVELRKKNLPIESLTYDTGPRRVLFVVDTGRHLPGEVRKMEYALLAHLLTTARPGDTFALLTARGASRQVRFVEGKDAVSKAVQELSSDVKEDRKAGALLDTIAEGLNWFSAPQQGDAILLMTDQLVPSEATGKIQGGRFTAVMPLSERSKTSFNELVRLLGSHRARLFGVQFGGIAMNPDTYQATDENLIGLALGSGGYAIVDAMDPYGGYQLTSGRIDGLQKRVYQLSGAIAQFYALEVKAPLPLEKQQWKLELASNLRKNTNALYPKWFDPCPAK